MTIGLWWHVFGAEIPEMCEPDENGHSAAAYMLRIFGESTLGPDDLKPESKETHTEVLFGQEATVTYLGSFDHDPTDAEREALKPEEYREDAA